MGSWALVVEAVRRGERECMESWLGPCIFGLDEGRRKGSLANKVVNFSTSCWREVGEATDRSEAGQRRYASRSIQSHVSMRGDLGVVFRRVDMLPRCFVGVG
jgi:hypothetical protein